jgi:hypothetical protein
MADETSERRGFILIQRCNWLGIALILLPILPSEDLDFAS